MAVDGRAGKPVFKPVPPTVDGEKTLVRDISFCGAPEGGSNASMVDVKDGKIVRIRPMHYLWKYKEKDLNPWKMTVRGSTFEPSLKTLVPPFTLSYKKRVYSPARLRYPMKRVDWDPKGERNPQNRGKSKYVRISWDEALNLIVSEMSRLKEKYGPTCLLYQCDQHGENKVVQADHGAGRKLLHLWGGYTLQIRQPDSWEGWWWGSKHFWGCEPVGQGKQSNLLLDVAKNSELLLFWGCDQETTPWGWQGQLPSRLSYWYTELGIKQIYICPDVNYAAGVHADRWIPVLPNTDSALYLAITYHWFKTGGYDKEYLKTHAIGVEAFESYVMGKEDGVPKTPEWAATKCGVPARVIRELAGAAGRDRVVDEHAQHAAGDQDVAPAGEPLPVVRRGPVGAGIGRVVDQGHAGSGDGLADAAGEEGAAFDHCLAGEGRGHHPQEGRNDPAVEDHRAGPGPHLLRTEEPHGAHHGVVHGLVWRELSGTPTYAEPGAGLGVGTLAGDGVHREVRVGPAPARGDARGRGERHFHPAVGVVGRRHLAHPGIGGTRGAFEIERQGDLLLHGGGLDAVVPQTEVRRLDAVGRGQHHVGVGGGEPRVVARVRQRVGHHRRVERLGPGEADAAALRSFEDDTDADPRRVGGGERFDLAVVGPDLGVGAAADVDLETLARFGPVHHRGGQVEQVAGHPVTPSRPG